MQIEPSVDGAKISYFTRDLNAIDRLSTMDKAKDLNAEIKVVRKKRSLNANAYHYVLCDRISKYTGLPADEVHFSLMSDYGTPWKDGDGNTRWVLLKDTKQLLGTGTYVRRTVHGEQRPNGDMYWWCMVIKPSHLYDTAEMSRLLDGTIAEAKEIGIEVETPDEIARMKALWGEE